MQSYKIIDEYENNYNKLIPIFINENKLENVGLLDQFKNVKIYGNLNQELYDLDDIIILLGLSKNKEFNYDDDEIIEANIIINNKEYNKKLLTKHGLNRIIYQSNTHIGKLFRKCITFIIDKLFEQKYVTMDEINLNTEENNKELYLKALKSLKKNNKKLKNKNINLQNRIEIIVQQEKETRQKNKDNELKINSLSEELEFINNRNKRLENEYDQLENESQKNPNYINNKKIIELQKKSWKSIYIYLENSPDKETDLLIYNKYDINEYCEINPPLEEETFTYNIYNKKSKSKNKTLVKTLYVPPSLDDNSHHKFYEKFNKLKDIMYSDLNGYKHISKEKDYLICSLYDVKIEFDNINTQS